MRKTGMKILAIFMMMFVTFILWGGKVNAASASIGVSKGTVTEGETITVTVNFGEKVKSAQMIFSFNSSNLEYKSSNGTYNPSTKKYAAFSMSGDTLSSATFTFKATKSGSVGFSFSNLALQSTEKGRFTPTVASSSVNVTVKEKESSNGGTTTKPNDKPSTDNNKPSTGDNKPSTGDNKPTFSSTSQKVYATETVTIRESWSSSSTRLGTLQKNSSITRTGIGSNGWDRVNYNGRTAYISHSYLTTTKPKEDKDDKNNKTNEENSNKTNETSNTTNNEVANNTVNNETTNNQTNDITNNQTNEATNTQSANNNNQTTEKKGFSMNTIEMIIISVIVLAIVVIIVNEISAKKREEKRRAAKKRERERMKGSGR